MEKKNMTAVIARCLNGDAAAQEELVLAVQNRVYYHCRKMLKDEDRALDLTQDVLLAMLTKLHTLQQPEYFWTWLGGITANLCRNAINRGPREMQIPEDEEGNSLLDTYETLDEQTIPDKALDNDETRRMIAELVDALPEAQRECVLLYYYDEMSVREIAVSLDVSENTVKSRLNYARKSIKEGVERYEKQGVKLYGFSPLPFLLFFLRKDAYACSMTGEQAAAVAARVLKSAAASTAAGVSGGKAAAGAAAAAKTGAKAALFGLSTKVIAGITAGVVLAGSVAGVTLLGGDRSGGNGRDDGWKSMEYVALPAWVDEPFDQVGGYFLEDYVTSVSENLNSEEFPHRTCWYTAADGEDLFCTMAELEDDRIQTLEINRPGLSVGWLDVKLGDSYESVMNRLGIDELPAEGNLVSCHFDEDGRDGEYIAETAEYLAPGTREVNLWYWSEEMEDEGCAPLFSFTFEHDTLCSAGYYLTLTEEDGEPSAEDRSEEGGNAVNDNSEAESLPVKEDLSLDGMEIAFAGELVELAVPFRAYSMMFTWTQESYYAVGEGTLFTVANNGTDQNQYVEIYALEYLRSEESFVSQVVHDGEFVELDMLGEYWGNEDEALYLSAQQSSALSAGEGLCWVKSAQGGEDVDVLRLYPGESAAFRLPERQQDAVYLLFVRYRSAAGDLDLPVQSFWVTADDVSSPANDAVPR